MTDPLDPTELLAEAQALPLIAPGEARRLLREAEAVYLHELQQIRAGLGIGADFLAEVKADWGRAFFRYRWSCRRGHKWAQPIEDCADLIADWKNHDADMYVRKNFVSVGDNLVRVRRPVIRKKRT